MITLPTRTDVARYSQRVELSGTKFLFDFEWNDRDQHWFFDVSTDAEVKLLSGIKVVVGASLISRYRDERLPAGVLEAIDTSGKQVDPAFADLGDRVVLVFVPVAELDSSWVLRA